MDASLKINSNSKFEFDMSSFVQNTKKYKLSSQFCCYIQTKNKMKEKQSSESGLCKFVSYCFKCKFRCAS